MLRRVFSDLSESNEVREMRKRSLLEHLCALRDGHHPGFPRRKFVAKPQRQARLRPKT